MKKFLLGLVLVGGGLFAWLVYERVFVEKSFGASAMAGFAILGTFLLLVLLTWLLYDTRHRGKMTALWLTGFSTIGFYLVADLIVGWFLIKPLSPALVPDRIMHHKLVPDSWSRIEQPDFSYVQRVNKLGLRGKETTLDKPVGTVRILLLGDSFTMGKGVTDEQTFAVLMEKSLNERAAATCGSRRIEVLNGGVDSYAPVLSNLELRTDLHRLSPDLVIENLDVSDLIQEAAYRGQAVRENGVITGVPNTGREDSVTDKIRDWIDQHLFFTRAGLYYVNKLVDKGEVTVRSVATHANRELVAYTLTNDETPREQQWNDVFDSLSAMKAYADAMPADFLLSVYPWPHEVSDTEWVPGRYTVMTKDEKASGRRLETIRALSAERGIPLAVAHDAFRAYAGKERLNFKQDVHWTPAGQRVMAESLGQYVEANYWNKWCH